MLNTQKRKRDATLALRMPTSRSMIGESAPPLQPARDDQSLALEQVLGKFAAGEGGETGMEVEELSALALRMMKFLGEKNEIHNAVAIMNMSRMQAAHSSQERKMAESLGSRKREILELRRRNDFLNDEMDIVIEEKEELEACEEESRVYIKKVEAERREFKAHNRYLSDKTDYLRREIDMMSRKLQKREVEQRESARVIYQLGEECATLRSEIVKLEIEEVASSDSNADDSDPIPDSDILRSLKTAFSGCLKALEIFSKYLHKKLAEATGRSGHSVEILEQLLEVFGVMECAGVAMIAEFPQRKINVWDYWISSVLFNEFENYLFGLEDVMDAANPVDAEQHSAECYQMAQEMAEKSPVDIYDCDIRFQHFCDKNYVEVLPPWLVQQLTQSPDVERDECGRFEGDRYYRAKFLAVAKEVWVLHKLVSSFHVPASILRASSGTVFQSQHHAWVMHPAAESCMRIVVCMITPGFRVGNEVIRSRVLCY